jgi:protoporphyrinogen oxidase
MGVVIKTNTKVEKLIIKNNVLTGIKTSNGVIRDGSFLATIPTMYLANLIEKDNKKYADSLRKIEYFGAVCTIIETKKKISPVYWLNVADAGFPFGGVIEQTNLVNARHYKGSHIIYLSRYFSQKDDLYSMDNDQIKKIMMNGFYKLFPKVKKTDIKKVYIFRTNTAATVCGLNFSKIVPKAKSPIKNLYIGAMAHIYPDERSCNNSIRVAAEVCRLMGMDTSFVPKNQSLSGEVGIK